MHVIALLVLIPQATLDTEGKLSLADAAFSLSFDSLESVEEGVVTATTLQGQLIDPLTLTDQLVTDTDKALEGTGFFRVGGDVAHLNIEVAQLTNLVGRRVQFTFWQKPEGTRLQTAMYWYGGDVASSDVTFLGQLAFQPTGNVTTDGWEEWTSAPVDFAWGGAFVPLSLSMYDEQIVGFYGGADFDDTAHVLVDALSIVDLGEAAVPVARCTLPTESSVCGDEGVCHYGVCVDAALHVGAALVGDKLRADYLDRRAFEIATFEGGRAPLSRTANAGALIKALKSAPHARTFWSALSQAYDTLIDGHASSPSVGYGSFINAGVCLGEGVADLVDGAPITPLVFSREDNDIGSLVQEGDALVSIDGLSVDAWREVARRMVRHPGDPEGKNFVSTPSIMNAAIDSGAVLTFKRCSAPSGCEDVVVDLAALTGDLLLAGTSPEHLSFRSPSAFARCDYRFRRFVSSPDVQDYDFAGSATDEDGIRHVLINGVPGFQYSGGPAWFAAVDDAFEDAPDRVVLDERTGGGGSIDAVDRLASLLLHQNEVYAMDFLPGFESDDLASSRAAVVGCSEDNDNYGFGCGNGFRWYVGDAGGNIGVAGDSKLAVLIGSDVSGNDYLTRLLVERAAETRVFGAGSTWGAFGVIWGMPSHVGELSGGSLQVQDTIFLDAADDPSNTFETSTGIRPDVVVRQTQSDAIAGVDTVVIAAKTWLLE